MTRRKSREDALRILFNWNITNSEIEDIIKIYVKNFKKENLSEFTLNLINGVIKNIETIDEKIKEFSKEWHLERIFTIDRNILRIAIYEILFCEEIPGISSINEAIELAKKYSSDDAAKFINGILDTVLKDLKQHD